MSEMQHANGRLLDWWALVIAIVGVGLGLPLLGGWMYLTRKTDLTSGRPHERSLDVPTLVEGTSQDHEGNENMPGAN